MTKYRASENTVVFGKYMYIFDTSTAADEFEICLKSNDVELCRAYTHPTRVLCPIKLKSELQFIGEACDRRIALQLARIEGEREKRLNKRYDPPPVGLSSSAAMPGASSGMALPVHDAPFSLPSSLSQPSSASASHIPPLSSTASSSSASSSSSVRLFRNPIQGMPVPATLPAPASYASKHVSFVVHAHGGHWQATANESMTYPNCRIHFYWNKSETSLDAEKKSADKQWPKLLTGHAECGFGFQSYQQILEPGQACEQLLLTPDRQGNLPNQGIWLVVRESFDSAPFRCERVFEINAFETLKKIINEKIMPLCQRHEIPMPVNIVWLACRAAMTHTNPADRMSE